MRQFAVLRLGLQSTPHDLRPRPDQGLLQFLSNNLLRNVLYEELVAFNDAFHLLIHFLHELLALFVDHSARHLQLFFL